jgi:hypothetical protein
MKKQILTVIAFIIMFLAIFIYGMNRIDKINSGEMTLVEQSQMDR